jgi:2-polyprenyl-3-methyl-5-hydroxy-6-metoxy-1,4-benzoquinol methylase
MIVTRQPRRVEGWRPLKATSQSQDYYWQRDCPEDLSDYWEPKADPDGNLRDRFSEAERFQYLGDMADEIEWLTGEAREDLRNDSILDVGCGPGWLIDYLGQTGAWCYWSGVEPSEACRDYRKERTGHTTYSTLDEARGNYGCIICHHVIEHVPDPCDMLQRIRNRLVPGGKLLIATPDFASPCALRFGGNYRMLHDQTHISLFTLESMHRFLRDNGFTIDRVAFPFPERYATADTMERWSDTSQVSPPWPGNWMTFYCTR